MAHICAADASKLDAGGAAMGTYSEVTLSFLLYATLNMFLNWWNSWAQPPVTKMFKFPFWTAWQFACGGFSFPFFYSFFHTISSVIGAAVMMKLKPPQSGWPTFKQGWEYRWPIICIASAHVTNIGLNNASLVSVSLFINQIIKSLAPFPTMIAEYFLMGERQTYAIVGSVFVLVTGACLSIHFDSCGSSDPKTTQHTAGTVHGKLPASSEHCDDTSMVVMGITCVVIATVASSLKPVFGALVMKGSDKPKLEPSLILFYEQNVSMVLMFFLALAECLYDGWAPLKYLASEDGWKGGIVIAVGSLSAFFYNLSVYYFTRAASALAVMIASNFIKVLLIILSALQDAKSTSWLNVVGITIFFGGVVSYAFLSYQNKRRKAAKGGLEAGLKQPLSESSPLNGDTSATCCLIM